MCSRCTPGDPVSADLYHGGYRWVKCMDCERIFRIYGDTRDKLPPCKRCKSPRTTGTSNPRRLGAGYSAAKQRSTAVVFRTYDSKGRPRYSYPARPDAPVPPNYERVELTSIADMRRHEAETGARNELIDYDNPDTNIDESPPPEDDIDTDGGAGDLRDLLL